MEPIETIAVDATRVACDGGGDPGGHPRVFLNLGEAGRVDCPYCGRCYVLEQREQTPAGG